MPDVIKKTKSICPVCLKTINAEVVRKNDDCYLVKDCEEHGHFETIIWRGNPPYESWLRIKTPAYPKIPYTKVAKGCPNDCGLCSEHRQNTCTALIEVTSRCNLNCKFCFADAKGTFEDPDIKTIEMWYKRIIKAQGHKNLQISGGEPTVREDLPQIISLASKMGFDFIQLNTNGIKLNDIDYYKKLKEAGLKSIFLQFDGLSGDVLSELRGRDILNEKIKAIENSKKLGIGVVLVCTVVPHINDDLLWSIIDFGLKNSPTIRGVHFQPVSYFGRIPKIPSDFDRITLPELMSNIQEQSGYIVKLGDFSPSGCENSYCSFHANYIYTDGKIISVSKRNNCCNVENGNEGSNKNIKFIEKNWSAAKIDKYRPPKNSFEELALKLQNGFFTVSAMAFQDAWNLDLERLKDCCIHVVSKEGNLIPFCAYNITSCNNINLYR